MKSVWAVVFQCFDELAIVGIFSTEAAANLYLATTTLNYSKDKYFVEEYKVDELLTPRNKAFLLIAEVLERGT